VRAAGAGGRRLRTTGTTPCRPPPGAVERLVGDRAHGSTAGGGHGTRVPAHDRGADHHLVADGGEQLEALALELHRVDAEVHEHPPARRRQDDEGVRVQDDDPSVDRRDDRGGTGVGVDGDAGSGHLLREDEVGHVGQRQHATGERRADDERLARHPGWTAER
jgi:hypothetical protein